jgi:hypothetical protein
MKLIKECPFDFDQTKKLGHMRADFDGGRDVRPYKTWFGTGNWKNKIDEFGISAEDMDEAVNFVCSDEVNTYSKLLKYTGYLENPYDSVNYYFQHKNIDVWVRMIPAKDDYNMYINLYHR